MEFLWMFHEKLIKYFFFLLFQPAVNFTRDQIELLVGTQPTLARTHGRLH
jgi:hypothetical protein